MSEDTEDEKYRKIAIRVVIVIVAMILFCLGVGTWSFIEIIQWLTSK